jgi:hypothetical protein
MLQPLKKLKEKIDERKARRDKKKEPQMYKKPSSSIEDSFRSIGYKKGGAVKKVTAKKVMVKSKKK